MKFKLNVFEYNNFDIFFWSLLCKDLYIWYCGLILVLVVNSVFVVKILIKL